MAKKKQPHLSRHLHGVARHTREILRAPRKSLSWQERAAIIGGSMVVAGLLFLAMWEIPRVSETNPEPILSLIFHHPPPSEPVDFTVPVREKPKRFPARSHMPPRREEFVSGSPGGKFYAKVDLITLDDSRVWWESDNDKNDTENDHLFHRAMELPMRRLFELVSAAGGTLKVQDSYRAEGIHAPKSLHREGRAVDITCDALGLEELAKLAWQAGFDWVYHEVPRNGGAHVHASVRTDHGSEQTIRSISTATVQ